MSFILPFTVRSEDRLKRFSRNMEQAVIFCLTEIGRNKGGLLRKKPAEETLFITEACYPVWCVPWGRTTLFFDGLGLGKHTVSFDIIPDINVFIKEVKANSGKPETYLDFLTHNVNYFQNFAGKSKKVINGLIANPSFLKDFELYLRKAKRVKDSIFDKVILTPFMDEDAVKSSVKGLSELKADLENDIKKLNTIVKMLVRLTDRHIKFLLKRNEEIRQKAEKEIARFRSQTFKKTERMRRRYDRKILKISKNAENQIQGLQREYEEAEKRKAHLTVYAEKCETEISNCEARKENTGLDRWREELQKCKDEISEIENRISETKTKIAEIEQSRDIKVSQLEAEFTARSETLMTDLKKIEEARDAKIALNEERMKLLKDSTSTFIAKINRLIDLKKSAIADLEKIGLPQIRRKYAVVYIPFFLTCYEQKFKRRYKLFPPSFAHGMRGVTKIKGVFKTSKVAVLLDDRSESITKFLNRVIQLIKQNPIFEEKIVKAGAKINLLGTKENRKELARGLENLRREGWLSENEFQSFKKQLTV